MVATECPRCGAAWDSDQPDTLVRCSSCGALLAVASASKRATVARLRVSAHQARRRVARMVARTGRRWVPGVPQIVFYPFGVTGEPRHPLTPLCALPPTLSRGWRPGGADLLIADGSRGLHELEQHGAVTVPVPLEREGTVQSIVHYPVLRVPLLDGSEDSAAWCDGITAQVILPESLALQVASAAPESDLRPWIWGALASAATAALVFPFAWAVGICALLAIGLWWKALR